MKINTLRLLIRSVKGIVAALEEWLNDLLKKKSEDKEFEDVNKPHD